MLFSSLILSIGKFVVVITVAQHSFDRRRSPCQRCEHQGFCLNTKQFISKLPG